MKSFETDQFFHIGQSHLKTGKPCQDYSLTVNRDGMAFAVVSDGCSSGRYTDVGSRVLSFATAKGVLQHWGVKDPINESTHLSVDVNQNLILDSSKSLLGVRTDDLQATCVYAYVTENGGYVSVSGDGVVVFVYKSGRRVAYNIIWPESRPFYPAYRQESTLSSFIEKSGGDLDSAFVVQEKYTQEIDEDWQRCEPEEVSLRDGIKGVIFPVEFGQEDELEYVALFSDGVTQFLDSEMGEVSWPSVIGKFLDFKQTRGEFLKRRMNKQLLMYQKEGVSFRDDVSAAVIHITEKEESHEQDDD